MFRKIDDFLKAWAWDTDSTEKVFKNLTDESLSQRVTPEGRTLGRIAWHIVQTLPEMCNRTGLEVVGPGEDDPVPSSAAEKSSGSTSGKPVDESKDSSSIYWTPHICDSVLHLR